MLSIGLPVEGDGAGSADGSSARNRPRTIALVARSFVLSSLVSRTDSHKLFRHGHGSRDACVGTLPVREGDWPGCREGEGTRRRIVEIGWFGVGVLVEDRGVSLEGAILEHDPLVRAIRIDFAVLVNAGSHPVVSNGTHHDEFARRSSQVRVCPE